MRKNGTNEIMKFGETTRGLKRYTKKFREAEQVWMDFVEHGTKKEMHDWQHNMIVEYAKKHNGKRPPWNKNWY